MRPFEGNQNAGEALGENELSSPALGHIDKRFFLAYSIKIVAERNFLDNVLIG